jgi:hypothetical protein
MSHFTEKRLGRETKGGRELHRSRLKRVERGKSRHDASITEEAWLEAARREANVHLMDCMSAEAPELTWTWWWVGGISRSEKEAGNERKAAKGERREREGRERLDLVALRTTQGGKGDALERGEI